MINAHTKADLVVLHPASTIHSDLNLQSESLASYSTPADRTSSLLGCIATATQPHLQKVSQTSFSPNFFFFFDSRNKQASWWLSKQSCSAWVLCTALLSSLLWQLKGSNRKNLYKETRNLKPRFISARNWPHDYDFSLPLCWPQGSLSYDEVVKWRDVLDCFWVWQSHGGKCLFVHGSRWPSIHL